MARAAISKMSWENHVLRPVQNAPPSIIPTLIYGTAWKKTQTTDLVHQALSTGFRAVDTAAQPKHYREDLVGEGIRRALNDGAIQRKDLHVSPRHYTRWESQSSGQACGCCILMHWPPR